jgi:hypothetical protein
MKPVKRKFESNGQEEQDAAGEGHGETEDINNCIQLVPREIAPGGEQGVD